MTAPESQFLAVHGLRLRLLGWEGEAGRAPFLLLHGLASNARIWEPVAGKLAEAGHPAYALDLRGHGQSQAPEDGFGFNRVAGDVAGVVEALGLDRCLVVGHSWGGLVALEYAAGHSLGGLGLIDGGFTQLSDAPGATWEKVEKALTPPRLAGSPSSSLIEYIERAHPDWPTDVPWREIVLANFELYPDGTLAPHLSFENHMQVVRAMWEFATYERFDRVPCPVVIVAARLTAPHAGRDDAFLEAKRRGERQAQARLGRVRFIWMDDTDHDIPLHRPAELAASLLELAAEAGR
jgi:pimeloyl-ACP methyl ester carboxylesterase